MPLLTKADPPRKRRAPLWALALAAIVLLPLGLFAWSWHQPVELAASGHQLNFGYGKYAETVIAVDPGKGTPPVFVKGLRVPGFLGGGAYFVWWY